MEPQAAQPRFSRRTILLIVAILIVACCAVVALILILLGSMAGQVVSQVGS